MDYSTITVKVQKDMTACISDDSVAESGEDLERNAVKPGPPQGGTRPKKLFKIAIVE